MLRDLSLLPLIGNSPRAHPFCSILQQVPHVYVGDRRPSARMSPSTPRDALLTSRCGSPGSTTQLANPHPQLKSIHPSRAHSVFGPILERRRLLRSCRRIHGRVSEALYLVLAVQYPPLSLPRSTASMNFRERVRW